MWSQKLNSMILMGSFKTRIFYDSWQSMFSCAKSAFFAPVEHRKYICVYILHSNSLLNCFKTVKTS